MPGVPQRPDDAAVARLIGEESHRSASRLAGVPGFGDGNSVVGDHIRGEGHGRTDVVRRQVRIRVEKVVDGGALGQLAQKQLHGDSCATNYGLAAENARIGMNSGWLGHAVHRTVRRRNREGSLKV